MFTVVSYFTENYQSLVDRTWFSNKVQYCKRHGYSHHLVKGVWESMHQFQTLKVDILKDVISKIPEDSWIWWTGADLMVTNFTIKLEDIIDTDYHMIIASDFNGINADSFLLRNSEQGRAYLQMISDTLPQYVDKWEGEQGIMKDTYEHYKTSVVKLVPQRELNSYQYSLYRGGIYPEPLIDNLGTVGDWALGDFVIQWPATSLEFRIQAFDHYSQFIIK